MSPLSQKTVRRFFYDPLDRFVSTNATLLFYNQTRLATEVEGERTNRLFEYDAQPLALQQNGTTCTLLATDMQTSVLQGVSTDGTQQALAYTPYGHQKDLKTLPGLCGFNGERPDPLTGHYLLGQGYRAFNPVLMRFNSPDNLSPFAEGGINAYAYCGGDPANKVDPTGHIPIPPKLSNLIVRLKTPAWTTRNSVVTLANTQPLSRVGSNSSLTEFGSRSLSNSPSGSLSDVSLDTITPRSSQSLIEPSGSVPNTPPVQRQRRAGINLQPGDEMYEALRAHFGVTNRASTASQNSIARQQSTPRWQQQSLQPPPYAEASSPPSYYNAVILSPHSNRPKPPLSEGKRDSIRAVDQTNTLL